MEEIFARIKDQCVRYDKPVHGMESFPVGLYGLSWPTIRLGNIIAIAAVALKRGQDG